MQASQPSKINQINQIFNKYDTDHDGQVNNDQIDHILKQIGYSNVYIGTINKVIRLMNYQNQSRNTLNFMEVQQFANALINEGKFKVWKAKYSLLQEFQQSKVNFNKNNQSQQENNNNAAPGSSPQQNQNNSFINDKSSPNQQGQIKLNVGSGQTNFNHHFQVKLQKKYGQQVKPFIKLTIQRQTHQQATKIQTLFKSIYDTVIEIIQAQQEQLIQQIKSIKFITNVIENKFNLFITTGNKQLLDLFQLCADYLNITTQQAVQGKIQMKYKFNFDFDKFLTQSNYNFYDLLVKNCHFSIKWNIWELFKVLRYIFLTGQDMHSLKYNQQDHAAIFIIALLHCQKFTGVLQFQNTQSQYQQTYSKEQLSKILNQIRSQIHQLQESSNLNIMGLIQELDGKINIQVGIKDWRLNVDLNVKGLCKIFTQQLNVQANNYD